ncbi:hypothetical protein [Pseudonocardia asaccharolytica]|uniref:Bacterial transcriptional activator domain-containing protein n=1 Tax=Pseudonocardia asaccharolytica DSM 44247 = NBRC 16224 TaxID=1123024 RepID=A0A511CZJ4_9PSEU|nr:hypothetical protein [Pseudonocardia asaccharolytica]GEL17887.1 hypothetical protein PA7_17240 [Pseudonocardia asaccharolytica DSM 44247 = NBRC 16224]
MTRPRRRRPRRIHGRRSRGQLAADQQAQRQRRRARRVRALVYLAGLRLRTGERDAAVALLAEVNALELSVADREALATDLATAAELAVELGS